MPVPDEICVRRAAVMMFADFRTHQTTALPSARGRPAVVVRIREACEGEKAIGHVVESGCP